MIPISILLKLLAFEIAGRSMIVGLATFLVSMVIDLVFFVRHQRGLKQPARGAFLDFLRVNLGCIIIGFFLMQCVDFMLIRFKEGIPLLASLMGALLNGVGLPVSSVDGVLHLTTMAGPLSFPVSYDNLAAKPVALFLGFGLVYQLIMKSSRQAFASAFTWYALATLTAGFLRTLFSIGLFVTACYFIKSETEELPMAPFIDPVLVTLSLVPFLVLFMPLFRARRVFSFSEDPSSESAPATGLPGLFGLGKRKRVLTYAGILAVLLFTICWEPMGTKKNGKVVINTFHTKWSRTDREYDKTWFGSGSGYNYYNLKKFYEIFFDVTELKTRINEDALADASVLMIYDPSEAFTEDELRIIERFVKRGGGLLLIGDHTNVFGSTSHLNTVCKPFGFQYRDDVLFDQQADFFQILFPSKTSSHLLTGIDLFKLRGPCSIRPTSMFTSSVMEIPNSKSLRAIYSVNNFYPRPADAPDMKYGLFSVAVASHAGKGRVLAFGDSTVFSQFEIFYPGKYEFLSNGMAWLNHRDVGIRGPLRVVAACLLLGFLIFLLVRCAHPRALFSWGMISILLFFLVSTGATMIRRQWTHPPEIRTPTQTLFFVADEFDDKWGLRIFTPKGEHKDRYDIFTQWVLRNKMLPMFYMSGEKYSRYLFDRFVTSEKVDTGAVVLIRNQAELEALKPAERKLLNNNKRFLYLVGNPLDEKMAEEALIKAGYFTREALDQAEPLADLEDVKRIRQNDRTHLLVFQSERFSDRNMGFSEKVTPSDKQKAQYDQEYKLLDELFGVRKEP